MTASSREFRADLRMSLTPVTLVQLGLATFCFFAADTLAESFGRPIVLVVSLLLYVGAALTWLTGHWRAWIGRWAAVLVFGLAVTVAARWLPIPGVQTLFLIPVGLIVVLVGLPADVRQVETGAPSSFRKAIRRASAITSQPAKWRRDRRCPRVLARFISIIRYV